MTMTGSTAFYSAKRCARTLLNPSAIMPSIVMSLSTTLSEDITDSVRTGKPVIDDLFGFLRANPDQETIFHAGMSNRGRVEAAAFLKAYKFSEPQTVVDVGGGNGGFLSAILACNDHLSGVLFDQGSAIEAAKAVHRRGRFAPLQIGAGRLL